MKLSEAILNGMERFPKQAFGVYQEGRDAACVLGCANYAVSGDPWDWSFSNWWRARLEFMQAYGLDLVEANDMGFLREEIVGMLQAIGQ